MTFKNLNILSKRIILLMLFLLYTSISFGQVMIFEFYTHGGNSTARYNNDFVVLYNSGASSQSLNGWSLQYAGATGSSWDNFSFSSSAIIPAMSYFLVILETSGTTGVSTPSVSLTPSGSQQLGESTAAFGSGAMGTTAGKLALLNSTVTLTDANPLSPLNASVIDFVGYTSNQATNPVSAFEGSNPAPNGTASRGVWRSNATDTDDNSTDFTRTPIYSSGAFPLDFISFEGTQVGQSIELSWLTSNEINNSGFTVLRSTNAKNFERIGTIEPNEIGIYSFNDNNPKEGINYYQISQKDFDGSVSKTQIIDVLFLKSGEINVYPNPASVGEKINISGSDQYEVFQLNGVKLPQKKVNAGLPAGNYVLKVYHPYGSESKKLIVR